ncbi:MAG: methyltransferase domain-containing protein [Planctomycetota bacterium]
MNASAKTAIVRKKPSAPAARLVRDGRIVGRVLDYGSGLGFDADYYDWEAYDPNWRPLMPSGRFDTIVCNYVLNVVESVAERESIVLDIRDRLRPGGRAFITVRTDKAALNGRTKIGTWQGRIVLDLPIVQRGSGFVTYLVESED